MNNHVVLYRKYRPQKLDELVGRENIVNALKNAINYNQIAHAYLFCGPRGTGKTSLARIFSREINQNIDNVDDDIIEIDAASNNGVDEIRNLIDKVKFAPMRGKYKIYIIDEVHMLTTGAFNAFLKTIEEPPSHVIFILATTEPHKILETVLSRCQRYDFKPFKNEEIYNHLKNICQLENIKTDDESLNEITNLANGGMRDALSILEQLSTYTSKNINLQDVESLYGIIPIKVKKDLISLLLQQPSQDALINFLQHNFNNKNVDYELLFNDFIIVCRNLLLEEYEDTKIKKIVKIANKFINSLQKIKILKNVDYYFEIILIDLITELKTITNIANSNNVSRETFEQPKLEVKTYEKVVVDDIDYEYYLQLLMNANKKNKESYHSAFEKNSTKVLLNIDNIKYYTTLSNLELVAAGEQFLLFATDDDHLRNELLSYIKNDDIQFLKFINELLSSPKEIFIITQNQKENLIQIFKDKRTTNTLPKIEKLKFEIKTIVEEENSLKKMSDIFQEKLEIKENLEYEYTNVDEAS